MDEGTPVEVENASGRTRGSNVKSNSLIYAIFAGVASFCS